MLVKRVSFFVFIFAFFCIQAVQAHEYESLPPELTELLQTEVTSKGAIAGVSLRSAETGEILFEYNANLRLRPASNLKLLTAATALSVLGAEYSFSTDVLTDGKQHWKILNGNLYLKGKGDPTLRKEELDSLARTINEQNIKVVQGDLVADDTWYDDVRYSIDLPWSDETFAYASQVSALSLSPADTYDTGNVLIKVRPSSELGEQALVSMYPETKYIHLINSTETVNQEEISDLSFRREHGTNTIVINGKIPIDNKEEGKLVPVWEPANYVLDVFHQSLKEQGVIVLGEVIRGNTPDETRLLASNSSPPLEKIVLPFLKYSNNTHGEILVKEMGKVKKGNGSWDKGLEVMLEELASLEVHADTLLLRDGSGISHVNLIPANEITQLLYKIQSESWFPAYFEALPVAGVKDRKSGGTLRYRMNQLEGRVIGKTGTISSVSSLSGYAKTKSGNTVIYSILLNNFTENMNAAKRLEDKIISIIVNS